MTGFDDLMALLRLVTEPEAVQSRLAELQGAEAAAAARKLESDAAHAELATERERLTKLEAKLREREVAVFESEKRHERELDELHKWKREHSPPSRLVHHMGTLTSEPDDSVPATDPIDDPYSEPMDLVDPAPVQAQHSRRSLRRGVER